MCVFFSTNFDADFLQSIMIRKLVIIFLITQLDWIDCNQNESRNHNNNDDYHPIDMIKLWQQHNSQILNIYQIIISSNSVSDDNLCYQSIKHLVMDARKHEQYALKSKFYFN